MGTQAHKNFPPTEREERESEREREREREKSERAREDIYTGENKK